MEGLVLIFIFFVLMGIYRELGNICDELKKSNDIKATDLRKRGIH